MRKESRRSWKIGCARGGEGSGRRELMGGRKEKDEKVKRKRINRKTRRFKRVMKNINMVRRRRSRSSNINRKKNRMVKKIKMKMKCRMRRRPMKLPTTFC